MTKRISPLQGGTVDVTVVKASENDRCTCKPIAAFSAGKRLNPTCPVHGHGRPPGTGK